MRSIDFYEFVGVVVPGAILLIALGVLVDAGPAEALLVPSGLGNTIAYLVLAYVAGHLVGALGNWFEDLYWKPWKGMPTDWPIVRPDYHDAIAWERATEDYCGETCGKGDLRKWRRMVEQARSAVYAANRTTRLHIFNGNYGMFRGLVVVGLLVAVFAWQTKYDVLVVYSVIVPATALAGFRMHRFAVNYARELFANITELQDKKNLGVGQGGDRA